MSVTLSLYEVQPFARQHFELEVEFELEDSEKLKSMFPVKTLDKIVYDMERVFSEIGYNPNDYYLSKQTPYSFEFTHNTNETDIFEITDFNLPTTTIESEVLFCEQLRSYDVQDSSLCPLTVITKTSELVLTKNIFWGFENAYNDLCTIFKEGIHILILSR